MIFELSEKGIYFKILFDRYDFIQTSVGKLFFPTDVNNPMFRKHYTMNAFPNINNFLTYCSKSDYLYGLDEKYNVKKYTLEMSFDENNPWYNNSYILFNNNLLSKCKYDIKQLSFYICPAYNDRNEVEDIGFRITNQEDVSNAFKWIFTCGNNIIYGKNTVDKNKPCYIVEGFRDYVALNERGINAIGLGSVKISKEQENYINTLKEPVICFDNDGFGRKQTLSYKDKYKVAFMTNDEKDAWEAYVKGIPIDFVEIQ